MLIKFHERGGKMIEKAETPKKEKPSGDSKGNNDNGGGNGGEGSGGITKMCVQTDNFKSKIEKENWDEQLGLLETEHDMNLKKCLKAARDDIIKLFDEAGDVKKKYSDEYKNLKDEYDCKLTHNKCDLEKIPKERQNELKEMLKKLQQKIFNLGQCKSKFNCIELGTASDTSIGAAMPECDAYNYDTFVSCDMSAYAVLEAKTEIKLACKKEEVKNLKPLHVMIYELEKSTRYNVVINEEYKQLKESQKSIKDLLKKIDDYLKEIETLPADEKCKRWVYILLIENLLIDSCHLLIEPDKFKDKLTAKIKAVKKAKFDLCYRKYNKDKTEALLKFTTDNYESLKKNLETNALNRLIEE
jgi:hypothetical protein